MMNATGWNELYQGQLASAVYTMYESYFAGWLVVILFLTFQTMLYIKTQNINLCWLTGLFFVALFIGANVIKALSIQLIGLILVLELAGILYFVFFK